jgi:hypothetical protein
VRERNRDAGEGSAIAGFVPADSSHIQQIVVKVPNTAMNVTSPNDASVAGKKKPSSDSTRVQCAI